MSRMVGPGEIPIQHEVIDEQRLITRPWLMLFQGLLKLQRTLIEDTHANRLDKHAADQSRLGHWFYETDRKVVYQVRTVAKKKTWIYVTGTMRDALGNKPADLGTEDTGFLFYSTDYYRTFRWTGSAWEYAPGERLFREISFYPGTVPSGWAVCDGGSVTTTTATAGTSSFTTPDLTGQFLKGGTYSGSVVSAVAPALSGTLASESGHTHAIDHDHGSFTSGSPSATEPIAGGAGTAASSTHTHNIDVPAYTGSSGAGSAHTHGLGTVAVSATGEPAHVLLLPVVKL